MKKAQISMEFILIFAMALFIVMGFVYLINQRLTDINDEKDILAMRNLVNTIKSEVILASSVSNNYVRRFDIPLFLNGKNYTLMLVIFDEIHIDLYEDQHKVNEYTGVLPMQVKGTFIDTINRNTTNHCVTKSWIDGVRIARNQASLDPINNNPKRGDTIEIILGLYCVDPLRGLQFTLNYDPAVLEFDATSIEPLDWIQDKQYNPMFNHIEWHSSVGGNSPKGIPYQDPAIARVSYAMRGSECSGNTLTGSIAKISFEVKSSAPLGETEIGFDTNMLGNELELQDCITNINKPFPGSKYNAIIDVRN